MKSLILATLPMIFLSSCTLSQSDEWSWNHSSGAMTQSTEQKIIFTGSAFDSLASRSADANTISGTLPKWENSVFEDAFEEWKNIYTAKILWSSELKEVDKKYNDAVLSAIAWGKTSNLNDLKNQRNTLLKKLKTTTEYLEYLKKNEKRILELNEILKKYKSNWLTQEVFESYVPVQK